MIIFLEEAQVPASPARVHFFLTKTLHHLLPLWLGQVAVQGAARKTLLDVGSSVELSRYGNVERNVEKPQKILR